jgi:hypothetical protein
MLELVRLRRLAKVTSGRITMFATHDFAACRELDGKSFG